MIRAADARETRRWRRRRPRFPRPRWTTEMRTRTRGASAGSGSRASAARCSRLRRGTRGEAPRGSSSPWSGIPRARRRRRCARAAAPTSRCVSSSRGTRRCTARRSRSPPADARRPRKRATMIQSSRSGSRRRRNIESTGGDARRSCAPPRPPPAAPPRRPNRNRQLRRRRARPRRRYPRRRRARPDARTASGSRRSSCRTGAGSPLTRSKPYRCGDRFARERCCERRWRGGLGRVSTRAARDERGRETRRRRGEKRREPGESLPSRACSDGKKTLDWPSAIAGRTRRRGSTRCTARAAGASPTSSRRGGPL